MKIDWYFVSIMAISCISALVSHTCREYSFAHGSVIGFAVVAGYFIGRLQEHNS